jgi:hypothetical protein
MMAAVGTCFSCKKEASIDRNTGRREACPFCGADLRCCRNCRLYEPSVSKGCREPSAELVKEKTKANFCDFFLAREGAEAPARNSPEGAAGTRKALDDLFRK